MAYKDLTEFIGILEQKKLLKRVTAAVERELEITEIVDRVSKVNGPALLFENVKDSPYPVFINGFGSYERMNLALETDSLDDISDKINSILNLKEIANFFPKNVKNAPCQQVIEEPKLSQIPVLKSWPQDGGPSITLPLVFTKDPDTGQQNVGMYRMQIYDDRTTGMHWHLHKDGSNIYKKYKKLGSKMPVSVAIGCDPATIYAATAPLPKDFDEILFAGFLRKSPVEMVKCITNNISVPAHAEFILEGYVAIDEMRKEGPFGNHTGYYSIEDMYPVFHVEKVTRKHNPIYPSTLVGKPPMENCYLGKATERIFLPLLKMQFPQIIDINFPLEGIFNNCVIVSIDKQHPGDGKKMIHALWKTKQMMYTKMIVVVDKDIYPKDISTVAWKVFNNIDAKRDVVIEEGPLDPLDHASDTPHYGHKMGIDATKKWSSEGHQRAWPNDIKMTENIQNLVSKRWEEYGLD